MPASTVIVLACDVMSLIILVILLYSLLFENSDKNRKTHFFILCCVCTILSLATDIPAWYFENSPGHDTLLFIVNVLSLDFSLGAIAFISFYEFEFIGKEHISRIHANIISAVSVITVILLTVGSFTGKTFSVDNGAFTYGPWYSLAPGICLLLLMYMEAMAVIKAKYLRTHDLVAFLVYMVLPLVAAVIELFHPEISLALSAATLSSLLLYIMLQSGHVAELHIKGEMLNELSMKDISTGLQNRRACDMMLERLDGDDILNVIFCDLNGLKYINDTLGHRAGDERIIQFSEILKKRFSYDGIFRISGDEFIVLIPKLGPEPFQNRLLALKDELKALDDIAAVGAVSGRCSEKHRLLAEAESSMYIHKEACRERHPEYHR